MSEEARRIIYFMCKELSGCSYCYKDIVEDCYATAINSYKMLVPTESKEFIVDKVISILSESY